MDRQEIRNVVDERSAEWEDFDGQKKELVTDFAVEILEYAKKQGIEFDHSAGITFVSHLTTLYQRMFITGEEIEIEESLLDQITPELMEMSEGTGEIVMKYFGKKLNPGEIFLIATHLGSMQERIRQGVVD